MGAEPWERRAEHELRASGARRSRRTTPARDQLTAQELQVALVVAEGVTNREAAARLFLSPKTIEVHLSRAYQKLGVRTRTELSRSIARSRTADTMRTPARMLGAVLCTGIVSSVHEAYTDGAPSTSPDVATLVASNGGRLLNAADDDVLAMFDTPTPALRCAFVICATAHPGGRVARVAVHVGEVDSFPDGEISGFAVRIAEGLLAHAGAGEVLVTQTVRDAVYGSAQDFRAHGEVSLAGLGRWRVLTAIPD
jgi:DNA-binding CsgD family transcriptional regulator